MHNRETRQHVLGICLCLLNSASGRSNANMARSVKVVAPSMVSLSDYRDRVNHWGIHHAAAYSDCAAQIRASINESLVRYDTVPGLKHAYSTVPLRY
jgi:hypothetical protein